MDPTIHFCLATGGDYAYSLSAIPLPGFTHNTSTEINEDRQRFWVDDNTGPIQTWDDFERSP